MGCPKNSTLYAWLSHNAWVPNQNARYLINEDLDNERLGIRSGRNKRYQRKYYNREVINLLEVYRGCPYLRGANLVEDNKRRRLYEPP